MRNSKEKEEEEQEEVQEEEEFGAVFLFPVVLTPRKDLLADCPLPGIFPPRFCDGWRRKEEKGVGLMMIDVYLF
jgi:hypothetical protein